VSRGSGIAAIKLMGLETGCCRHQGLRPDGLADRHGVGAGTTRPGIHSLNHARSHAVSLDGVSPRRIWANNTRATSSTVPLKAPKKEAGLNVCGGR